MPEIVQPDRRWPAMIAVTTVAALHIFLPDNLSVGPGWALVVLGLRIAASHAAEPTELARINTERAAIEATRIERERDCQTRFAVTRCVEDARQAHRLALAELRRQQVVIDEAERRQRASERVDELANRAAESIGPTPAPRSPRASEAGAKLRQPAAPAVRADPAPAGPLKPPKRQASAPEDGADAHALEASRAAAFEMRVKEAQAHRAAVERRNAERVQKGKASRPLPLPASGAAP